MKIFFIVIFVILYVSIFSQEKDKKFYTITKNYVDNEEGFHSDSIIFYSKLTKRKLFSFCKEFVWGDCNSMGYEWGKYYIVKDTIFLYSLYAYQGGGNVQPFGVRKKTFVLKDNKVVELENKIFLERQYTTGLSEWIDGVAYILNPPKTAIEEEKFKTYVTYIENEYKGKFLLHAEAKALLKEVRSKFILLIQAKKKEWDKLAAPYNSYKI